MFGTFRTLLALAVVISHLGTAPYMGTYAVFGFYCLSGYLMTLIMHETYGYSCAGATRYVLNRALRIYPLYFAAALLTLLLVFILGEASSRRYHEVIGYPMAPTEMLQNFSLVLSIHTDTRLVPPAWALTVELFFYVLIAIGASRTALLTSIWLSISVAYTIYLVAGDASFSYRYYTIAAASLPFALGASLYHFSKTPLPRTLDCIIGGHKSLAVLVLLLITNYAFAAHGGLLEANLGHFYLNLVVTTLLIANLAQRSPSKIDKRIGDLSYPIYLTHFQSGLILLWVFDVSWGRGEAIFVAASLPIVLSIAWGLSIALEQPIEKLREWVKHRHSSPSRRA